LRTLQAFKSIIYAISILFYDTLNTLIYQEYFGKYTYVCY